MEESVHHGNPVPVVDILFLGSPGIGKATFLSYVTICPSTKIALLSLRIADCGICETVFQFHLIPIVAATIGCHTVHVPKSSMLTDRPLPANYSTSAMGNLMSLLLENASLHRRVRCPST
jgi:hypothetical protein